MKISTINYNNPKQGYLPLFLSDCLDLLDPVLTFDRLMGGIDLNKYLTDIPEYTTGRLRYNPFNMLKTVLFGFMTSGYCSLREPEDNCKVNIRFMYLMDHHTPSYRTFGYFINEVLQDKIENIFNNISKKRDAKTLNRVFSHPLFVYIMICLISGFDCLEVFVFVDDTFDMHRQISDFSIAECAAQVFSDLIADGLRHLKCLWKFDFHVVV